MVRSPSIWLLEDLIEDSLSKKQLHAAVVKISDLYVKGHLSPYLYNSLLQRAASKSITI